MTTLASSIRPAPLPAVVWLIRRELIRFARQPSRIVGAVGTPILIWVFLSSGFSTPPGQQIAPGGGGGAGGIPYAAFLLPGMASMIVLFSAIFAAISLIEDRHEGLLQSVLVSPAPTWATVVSKVTAATILATGQAVLILLAAPLVGLHPGLGGFMAALGALACISLSIGGLSLALAWYVDSVQGFHSVMNLILMPMWLLSGAFFSVGGSAVWLAWIMRLNPLTWPTEALRAALLGDAAATRDAPAAIVWLVTLAFAAAGVALPWMVMRRPVRR